MCGIFALFGYQGDLEAFRPTALELSKKIRHRGPDWNGVQTSGKNLIAHERLAIVDLDSGAQPLTDVEGNYILSVNGEIYNHLALRAELKGQHTFKTNSDCEVILHMYKEIGPEVCNKLDGFFAFVLYDGEHFLAARDPIGITTLYQGWAADGSIWFASEMKCLAAHCNKIIAFPPGHYYSSKTGTHVRYYEPIWWNPDTYMPSTPPDHTRLREALENAVVKRLMADVPYGVLLSGGLDSSLIASIASRYMDKSAWGPVLHSFSIGLVGSPDVIAARTVASFLKTKHHEYYFTIQDGLDALSDVIYHLETYDVTTIRASTPMYLLSRKIKATGVKMVLSGEGSDEVFGGYLYFHSAPSPEELHRESVSRVKNLHLSDCLRANKSTMAWGLECRVPFLDKDFLNIAMTLDPKSKTCGNGVIEKYVIRKAFDTPDRPYLPDSILWRQKEQFSDGVGYGWIDSLRDHATGLVTDAELQNAHIRFPHDTPANKEAYYYRSIFEKHFPQPSCLQTVSRWVPRQDWGCPSDPSGRAQKVHAQSYDKAGVSVPKAVV